MKLYYLRTVSFFLLQWQIQPCEANNATFRNEQELVDAVDAYVGGNQNDVNSIIDKYGTIEEWDVSKISNFGNLFNRNRNPHAEFFEADLSKWDMGNAKYLHDMFLGAAAFDSDLSNWNVGKVQHFNGMFNGATSFQGRGMEKWDVSSGRLFMVVFADTQALRPEFDIRNWNVAKGERFTAMFRHSNFGSEANLCRWARKLDKDADVSAMFKRSNCQDTSDPNISNIATGGGVSLCRPCTSTDLDLTTTVFQNEQELVDAVDAYLGGNQNDVNSIIDKYGTIEEWDVSKISNFGNLFNRNRNPRAEFFGTDLSQWDMGNAKYLHDMFLGAAAFDSDLSNWNVGNVQHFNGMFNGATSFQGRGLEKWDVSSGRLFMVLFADTFSLRPGIDIRHWNVAKGERFTAMFRHSNFGNDATTGNLCRWASKLSQDADVSAMFKHSNCQDTSDPNISNIYDTSTGGGVSLCRPCTSADLDSATTEVPDDPVSTKQRPNVLFLMTDQQRFDTIRRVQNELSHYDNVTKIRTPNLDKLSEQGAYFRNAYCQCSVCGPARTSLRTGCTVERTGIQTNELLNEFKNSELFTERVEALEGLDQVLTKLGYVSEYYGKWHIPEVLSRSNNGGSKSVIQHNDYNYDTGEFFYRYDSNGRKIRRYMEHFEKQGIISKEISQEEEEQIDTFTGYPYKPSRIDSRYGYPSGAYETHQPNLVGVSSLSENFTTSHYTGDVTKRALKRLLDQDQPFFLTLSFHSPHPPMVPSWKHADYYWKNRDNLFVSPSINDKLENADYGRVANRLPKYKDPQIVKEWTALYYALIEEIDDYVGDVLSILGDAANNTLIVFTSDHGEMLGAHGKREKNNFFEEASRVPLFFSFPGKIEPGTVVDEMVSHLDVFATILDYIDEVDVNESDGSSLRPFIESSVYNQDFDENVVVAEWDYRKPLLDDLALLDRRMDERPSLMVRKGSYKLMVHKKSSSKKIDMMYNLDEDPFEVNNLLGSNAPTASEETLRKAEHLRCLLIDWMKRMDGDKNYYSDPIANYGEGQGDIKELQLRQSWPRLDFWISDSVLQFDRISWQGNTFTRTEYLYLGTRTASNVPISLINIEGADAGLFRLSGGGNNNLVLKPNECQSLQVTFESSVAEVFQTSIDAVITFRQQGRTHTIRIDVVAPTTKVLGDGTISERTSSTAVPTRTTGFPSSTTTSIAPSSREEEEDEEDSNIETILSLLDQVSLSSESSDDGSSNLPTYQPSQQPSLRPSSSSSPSSSSRPSSSSSSSSSPSTSNS